MIDFTSKGYPEHLPHGHNEWMMYTALLRARVDELEGRIADAAEYLANYEPAGWMNVVDILLGEEERP